MAGEEEGTRRNQENNRAKIREDEMGSNFNSGFCCRYKDTVITSFFVCYIRNKNCHLHNDACGKVTLRMTH